MIAATRAGRAAVALLALTTVSVPALAACTQPAPPAAPSTSPPAAPLVVPRPAPSSASDYPQDLVDSGGVYREALLLQPGADESRTWGVLDRAARTSAAVTLEVAVPNFAGRIRHVGQTTRIEVPPIATDPVAAARDERGGAGWALVVADEDLASGCPYGSFHRVSGTYRVARSGTGASTEFRLTRSGPGLPDFPPGDTDDRRCRGIDGRRQTRALVDQTARTLTEQNYAQVKSEWMSSPRVWWAIRDQQLLNAGGDAIIDPLLEACLPWQV